MALPGPLVGKRCSRPQPPALSMPMDSCALRLTVVGVRLVGEPVVQDLKGPLCTRIRGDDGPGPVPCETVDLDGVPSSMPIVAELWCVQFDFDVGLPPSVGPETERGRAVRRDGRMPRLQHGRVPAWDVQPHDLSMRMRIRVRSSEQRCGCKRVTPTLLRADQLILNSRLFLAAGTSGKLVRLRSSPSVRQLCFVGQRLGAEESLQTRIKKLRTLSTA